MYDSYGDTVIVEYNCGDDDVPYDVKIRHWDKGGVTTRIPYRVRMDHRLQTPDIVQEIRVEATSLEHTAIFAIQKSLLENQDKEIEVKCCEKVTPTKVCTGNDNCRCDDGETLVGYHFMYVNDVDDYYAQVNLKHSDDKIELLAQEPNNDNDIYCSPHATTGMVS